MRSIARTKTLRRQLGALAEDDRVHRLMDTLQTTHARLLRRVLVADSDVDAALGAMNLIESWIRHHVYGLAVWLDPPSADDYAVAADASRVGAGKTLRQLDVLRGVDFGRVLELLKRLVSMRSAPPALRDAWRAAALSRDEVALFEASAALGVVEKGDDRVSCLDVAVLAKKVRDHGAHGGLGPTQARSLLAPLVSAFLRLVLYVEARCSVRSALDPDATTTVEIDGTSHTSPGSGLLVADRQRLLMLDRIDVDSSLAVYLCFEGGDLARPLWVTRDLPTSTPLV